MRRFLILIASLTVLSATAQTLNPQDYVNPILNVAGHHSAGFGEMRPNHFHGGIDIKTDGMEGKPLIAVANGYVSRLSVSAGGYGRALYLTLDNGTTAVYGHISRFRSDIEEAVRAERVHQCSNNVQLYPGKTLFRVSQGDTIAYSGNSGSSFGPHLHFELRDTPSQKTLNIVRQGIARPKDSTPPLMMKLHYIEVDTLDGVPINAPLHSYPLLKRQGVYQPTQQEPVHVGRNGYFVLETSDRRDDVQNTFGLYRITAEKDGEAFYEYRMDGFLFTQSLYCNAAAYYPIQIDTHNEAIRLAIPEGSTEAFSPIHKQRGAICTTPGETHSIRIEAEDDCGNSSRLEFKIQGREESFHAQADSTLTNVYRNRTNTLKIAAEATATIPSGALYESIRCRPEIRNGHLRNDTTLMILTPVYRFLSPEIPLHKPMQITIRAVVPKELQPHVTLASRNNNGRLSIVGGSYTNGRLTASTRTTGDLVVVADTVPPQATPTFKEGADLRQAKGLEFRVTDNFSGITSWSLYIDGQWTPCDRYPIQKTLYAPFTAPATGTTHRIQLSIHDGCGNIATWKGSFQR